MKLKLVVASMSLLGLISCPSFAAPTMSATPPTNTDNKEPSQPQVNSSSEMKHHKMVKHHHAVRMNSDERERITEFHEASMVAPPPIPYKGEAPACVITPTTIILDHTTHNWGRALPNPCNPGWFNRINLSGGATIDLGKWGRHSAHYEGVNVKRFSLNDVYVNVSANVSEWSKVFASISYSDASSNGGNNSDFYGYSGVYPPNRLNLEQAYITFGNLDVTPFYIQLGKMFQDFSRYQIHPITRSMTQVLSEALETSGRVGFILPMGFHGSFFAFDDPIRKIGSTNTKTNYGLSVGLDQPHNQFGWGAGLAWLYNMMGAQDVAHAVSNFTGGGFHRRVDALAAYGDFNMGPFMLSGRWTGAIKRFNANDLPRHGFADVSPFDGLVFEDASGAKPWALGLTADYDFEALGCRNNNVYLGYQYSHQAVGIGLPRHRWELGYAVDLFGRNTLVAVQWDHDKDYRVHQGGTNRSSNLVSLRAGVQFG